MHTSALFCLFILPFLVASESLCGKTGSFTLGNYSFLPNAWGDDGSGFQCIEAAEPGSSFSSTWSWSEDRSATHAFACTRLEDDGFPIKISDATSMMLVADWTMSMSDSLDGETDSSVIANVAFDMFGDLDAAKASDPTEAAVEIMIWIGSRGSPQPLGFNKGKSNTTYLLGSMNYHLYIGTNQRGLQVFSWLATEDMPAYQTDVLPLISILAEMGYVDDGLYLGMLELGTEAFYSPNNVTFDVTNFQLAVGNMSDGSSSASSTSSASASASSTTGSGGSGWAKSSDASSHRRLSLWLVLFCAGVILSTIT